jgi:hypothetical protein
MEMSSGQSVSDRATPSFKKKSARARGVLTPSPLDISFLFRLPKQHTKPKQ